MEGWSWIIQRKLFMEKNDGFNSAAHTPEVFTFILQTLLELVVASSGVCGVNGQPKFNCGWNLRRWKG